MSRRLVGAVSAAVALVALAVVLYNATLVDRRPPSVLEVVLSAPVPGEPTLGQTRTAIDIRFSEPVRSPTVERRFRIDPYVAGTLIWEDAATAIYTPSEALPSDTEFRVTIEAGFLDLAGNPAETGLDEWTFRTVGPPRVVASAPEDMARDVAVDAVVSLTFDRLMDTVAVEEALTIDPPVAVRVTWSGPVLTILPEQRLAFDTAYAVTVGPGAADTDGSRLVAPHRLSFSTVSAGLAVVETIPAPSVAGTSVRGPIAVVFDGPIDPATIEDALRITPSVAGSLEIVDVADDSAVAPAPTPGVGESPDAVRSGRVLVFTPSEPLASHTTYTAVLEPRVARQGRPGEVAAGLIWTFTTGQPTENAQNQVAFLTARSGVRNVWLMNPDGSNARQLTAELVPVTGFESTGDGLALVYAAGGVVRRIAMDGSDIETITPDDRFDYAPRLAPDGSAVMVGRRTRSGEDLGWWLVPLGGLAAGPPRQVLDEGAPPVGSVAVAGEGVPEDAGVGAWGRRVAFDDGGRHVVIVDAAGDAWLIDLGDAPGAGPPRAVARLGLRADGAAAWSGRDGSFYVVARAAGDESAALWRVRPGGAIGRLFDARGTVAVAGDGSIAVLLPEPGGGLGHARTAGSAPEPITNATDVVDRLPAFSPDAQTILFARVEATLPGRSAGIWSVGPTGLELRQLTTDGTAPRWLP